MTESSPPSRPRIGELPPGARNAISDVPGVTVGHRTLASSAARTGVTVICPHDGDLFREKLPAAAHVFNGFGKSVGLMQVEELGQIETPIALTNTFSVGTVATALIRRAIAANPEIGRRTSTVNPIVCECNDGYLNDIQGFNVGEADVTAAIEDARPDFPRGAVGAGTGMSAFGLKGGIGTASRALTLDGQPFHLGALVLSNFGRRTDLRLDGRPVVQRPAAPDAPDRGSVIVVIGTDAPLEHRQLARVARRAVVGLVRVGSFLGHGSGDIALAFSTAERIHHEEPRDLLPRHALNETRIDLLFRACAEAVEDAVVDSLFSARPVTGRHGHRRDALGDAT
jgi:D-aminopeptidase